MIARKTDSQLCQEINEKLTASPEITPGDIAIAVNNGIVTLGGAVPKYSEKLAAERAVEKIIGVKGIVDEIKINIPAYFERSDLDIAKAAANSLSWNSVVPEGSVKVIVENGWLTLTGEVKWNFQKQSAASAVKNLLGVKGIVNNIAVKPSISPTDIKNKIINEFERNAILDATYIEVEVEGGIVTLKGKVRNFTEMLEAKQAAWSMPGVYEVRNNLTIF